MLKQSNALKMPKFWNKQTYMHLKSLNIRSNVQIFILEYFTATFWYSKFSTGNKNKFTATKCNMRKSEMSINYKSIQLWNKPPAVIRTSDSLNEFMDNLRNYNLSRHCMNSSLMYFFIFWDVYLSAMCYQQYDNIPSILVLGIVLSVRMSL